MTQPLSKSLAARRLTCVALVLYCLGIVVLALWPTDTISVSEVVVAVLAAVAIVGLVVRMVVTKPDTRWAYLIVGATALVTLLLYLLGSTDAYYVTWRMALLLAAGAIAGYGAYLAGDRV